MSHQRPLAAQLVSVNNRWLPPPSIRSVKRCPRLCFSTIRVNALGAAAAEGGVGRNKALISPSNREMSPLPVFRVACVGGWSAWCEDTHCIANHCIPAGYAPVIGQNIPALPLDEPRGNNHDRGGARVRGVRRFRGHTRAQSGPLRPATARAWAGSTWHGDTCRVRIPSLRASRDSLARLDLPSYSLRSPPNWLKECRGMDSLVVLALAAPK